MPFKYKHTNQDKIVFTRLNESGSRILIFLISIIFTIIGFGFLYFVKSSDVLITTLKFSFPSFGLMGIYIGIIFPKLQKTKIPDEIIFDNSKGRVEVKQKLSEINLAYIYYDEIADFVIIPKKIQQNNNTQITSYTKYNYHIYLVKKDGGQWELLKTSNEKKALLDVANLKTIIKLSVPPQKVELSVPQSLKYSILKKYNKVELSWRNKIGSSAFFLAIFSLVFVAFSYAIIYTGNSMFTDLPIFFYIVYGFIATLFVFVIGFNANAMIKNAKTIYSLVISDQFLTYFEKNQEEIIKKEIKIKFSDIHAISFSFDTDNTMRKIFVLTHEQFKQKNNTKVSLSLDYFKSIFEFYQSLVSLNIDDLTAVEALYIETYLQQQIREIGNVEIS